MSVGATTSTGWGMDPAGTTPSISANNALGYEIAYRSFNGDLFYWVPLLAGSSPVDNRRGHTVRNKPVHRRLTHHRSRRSRVPPAAGGWNAHCAVRTSEQRDELMLELTRIAKSDRI